MVDQGDIQTGQPGQGTGPKRIKAAIYDHLENGSQAPMEAILLARVLRFGAQAVYGRVIGAHELTRLAVVDGIITAHRERKHNQDWAAWVEKNPDLSRLLNEAAKLADEMDQG